MKKLFLLLAILIFVSKYSNSESLNRILQNQRTLDSNDKIGIEKLNEYFSNTNIKNWFVCGDYFSIYSVTIDNILLDEFLRDIDFEKKFFYGTSVRDLTDKQLESMGTFSYLTMILTVKKDNVSFNKNNNLFSWTYTSDYEPIKDQIYFNELVINNEKNPSYLYKTKRLKSDKKTVIGENKEECLDLKKLPFSEVITVYRLYQKYLLEENIRRRNLLNRKK